MSDDALFQLGIVSARLNASQTEISTRESAPYPNSRDSGRRGARPCARGVQGRGDAAVLHLFRPHHLRRYPALPRDQRSS